MGSLLASDQLTNRYVADETINLLLNDLEMLFILLPMFVLPFIYLTWAIDKRIDFMGQYIKVIKEILNKQQDSIDGTGNDVQVDKEKDEQ